MSDKKLETKTEQGFRLIAIEVAENGEFYGRPNPESGGIIHDNLGDEGVFKTLEDRFDKNGVSINKTQRVVAMIYLSYGGGDQAGIIRLPYKYFKKFEKPIILSQTESKTIDVLD